MEPAIPIVALGDSPGTIPFGELSGTRDDVIDAKRYAGRALYLDTSGSTDTYKRVC
jgi:hypothetical protein